jgi:hypothetical protein
LHLEGYGCSVNRPALNSKRPNSRKLVTDFLHTLTDAAASAAPSFVALAPEKQGNPLEIQLRFGRMKLAYA